MLKFKGSQNFRQRLVCSTLSGRPIRIDDIRTKSPNPGLRDFEASFLRLLEKITNGCVVEINETGTSLRYRPGVLTGGSGLTHECCLSRAVGYYIEPLLVLGLYGKKPLSVTLRGITNDSVDPTADFLRTATLPVLRRVLQCGAGTGSNGDANAAAADALELKVVNRGMRPNGGGEVQIRVPIIKTLDAINLTDEGMVKRIRGIAFSSRVPPQVTNRMVDGARGILNKMLADVYIFTDAVAGATAGKSPGFGLTLVAETANGNLLASEWCAAGGAGSSAQSGETGGGSGLSAEDLSSGLNAVDEVAVHGRKRPRNDDGHGNGGEGRGPSKDSWASAVAPEDPQEEAGGILELMVPEEIGEQAALQLMDEIRRGGVVDGAHQGLLILLAALAAEEANSVRLGPLTTQAVRTLRHVRDFFGVTFGVQKERQSSTAFLTCIGAGVKNLSKKAA